MTAGRLAHAQLRKGTAVYIMTGGTLPLEADAVVMVEEVEQTDGRAVLHHRPARGENVHPPGMDLTRGQHILAAGSRIGAAEVGLLATVGCARVPVYRRPRVAVLATGDELVEPHQTPPPGSVRDSNRYALMAAVEDAGAEVVWHAHARDDEQELERAMREGLAAADVLITSGGVSMGTRDLIKPLLERMATIQFGRVSFKPGKPLTFATTDDNKLAFGLPGFPVSSLVTFEVFVRPALLKLGGASGVAAASNGRARAPGPARRGAGRVPAGDPDLGKRSLRGPHDGLAIVEPTHVDCGRECAPRARTKQRDAAERHNGSGAAPGKPIIRP